MKKHYPDSPFSPPGSVEKLSKSRGKATHRLLQYLTGSKTLAALFLILTATASFAQNTAYCIPNTGNVDGQGITNVTIGTLTNTTTREAGNYGDFSALAAASVARGAAQPFSIGLFTSGEGYITKVWADWNNDFTFDDSEVVYNTVSPYTTRATLNGTLTVPVTAALGNHRLRVGILPEWQGTAPTPCFTGDWGAFEDYTINVLPAPSCFSPANVTVVNVSAGSININWAAPTLGDTPTGYEYAVTATQENPANGTPVTATSVTGVAVTPGSAGYLHVRTNCGSSSYSSWTTIPFLNAACIPAPTSVDGLGITNVTIGTLNNTTGRETGYYGDYSVQAVTVPQGVTQQFSVALTVFLPYNVKIWADWNDDLDFNDPGEEIYTGTSEDADSTILNGTFTVPATAALGTHRLRIGAVAGVATPCYAGSYGTFEDYTITVSTPPACFSPTNPSAQNTGTGIVTLSWVAPSLGTTPTGYEYAITQTATAPAGGTATTNTTITNTSVTVNVTNYLHVRTNCGNGNYSEWVTIPFYNGVCIPAPDHVDGPGITNVTIGSINNTTIDEPGNYANYSAQVVNVGQGVTQQVRISLATFLPYNVAIWVDWNDDLDFDDEGERVYTGLSGDAATSTLVGTFTVPATAILGNHRLRVGAVPEYSGAATPCFTGGRGNYGAYEDYTINVTVPPTCFTPDNPAGIGIASHNANLSWAAPAQGTTPVGYEYAVTTSLTPPAVGTATTATSVTGYTQMDDNTYYYLHVRTNCGGNDYSAWVTSVKFRFLAGDTCSTAIDLATLTSPYTTTTEGAEDDYTPFCGVSTIGDMFFSMVIPNGATLTINTNSDYDAIHAVFYGDCTAENQTIITCSNDDENTIIWENLTGSAKTLYYVQDGWFPDPGTFTLTWNLVPAPTCDVPRAPDVEMSSLTNATVSWNVPNTGTPVGYEYAVTGLATPPASGTYTTTTSGTVTTIVPNTQSYLHVRTICSTQDGNSTWITLPFFSGYCVPTNVASASYYITSITTTGAETNFTNTSSTFSAYTDYTSQYSVTSYPGGSFGIVATAPNSTDAYIYSVWVDWNNDFEFDDDERVLNSEYLTSPAVVGNIAIPNTMATGSYRMRIRNAHVGSPIPACGEQGSGEAEDYTLNIIAAPTCFPPYGLSITPIDTTVAELRWSIPAAGTPAGYEYILSNSATEPAGNGIPTTERFIGDATYNPAQSVYLFVRSVCGEGDYSSWATVAVLGTASPEITPNSVMVYKENSAINIKSGTTLITGVTIYDTRGRKLYHEADINAAQTTITGLQLQQQVVIIEVATAKGKVSKRIAF